MKTSTAETWREVFRRGARDALRLAARRLPPSTWAVLDELADTTYSADLTTRKDTSQ
jgi:hypothetical protein